MDSKTLDEVLEKLLELGFEQPTIYDLNYSDRIQLLEEVRDGLKSWNNKLVELGEQYSIECEDDNTHPLSFLFDNLIRYDEGGSIQVSLIDLIDLYFHKII
ncbi:MAG: hypothetical protein WC444_05915 [Candidatus Paceibacterota bacterium]